MSFKGESGLDFGGLFRDYMSNIATVINSSDIFEASPDGGLLPKKLPGEPDKRKKVSEALFAVGRVLALAITSGTPLGVCFSRCLYKLLLEEQIGAADLARIDPDFYKHRVKALLQPGGVATLEAALCDKLMFVGAPSADGVEEELVEGGKNKRVTEENKERYVSLLVEHYLLGHSRKALAMLVDGFREVVPKRVLKGGDLRAIELELIITGLPNVDLADWRKHTEFSPEKDIAKNAGLFTWFFEILEEMDAAERAKVLSFACGSGRLPSGGFKGLSPMFNVNIVPEAEDHVPTAHTCMNQLCLPRYTTKEKLRERLQTAIMSNAGFGFL